MPRKLLILAVAVGLVAAACSRPPEPEIALGDGPGFIPELVDFVDDVGVEPSLALDPDGNPFVAYFGFPAELEEGEIAPIRPVGAPDVPAVMLAGKLDGIWNRGAAAQPKPEGTIVSPPFGPAEVDAIKGLSPDAVTGIDLAIGGDGVAHVVWSTDDAVWYAANASGPFEAERIARGSGLGGASVAADGSGAPWVAFVRGAELVAATIDGRGWTTETVGPAEADAGTATVATSDGPLVAFASAGATRAATRADRGWSVEDVDPANGSLAIDAAVDGNGGVHVAYLDEGGSVHAARSSGGGAWQVDEVAPDAGVDDGSSVGVAAAADGTEYVTWRDVGEDRVELGTNEGGSFAPVETRGTRGGWQPTVAAAEDGALVFVAWYDPENGNLGFGTLGDAGSLELARPSPTPTAPGGGAAPPTGGPTPDGGDGGNGGGDGQELPCEPDGTELVIAAPQGAVASGFDVGCLAAPAGEAFTIAFDNQDTGVPHNVAGYTDESASQSLFVGEIITGPDQIVYEVDALEEGIYFFRCDVHPTTMTGTLVVA